MKKLFLIILILLLTLTGCAFVDEVIDLQQYNPICKKKKNNKTNSQTTQTQENENDTIVIPNDQEKLEVPKSEPKIPESKPDQKKSSEPKSTPDKIETKVYITETGEKYHKSDCQYLKKSKYEITLSEAKAQGYEPCKKCKP